MGERLLVVTSDTEGQHIPRRYTMIAERAVVGFRWTLYLHPVHTGWRALSMLYPGGVASGWVEADHEPDAVAVVFDHAMRMRRAAVEAHMRDDIDTSSVRNLPP